MMMRPSRLHNLLLLIVLLVPSWSVTEVWAEGRQGPAIGAVDGGPAGQLLQTRPAKDPVVSGSERHSGKNLGSGVAGGAFWAADLLAAFAGTDALASNPGTAPCRPHAERLPYHATAPPAR
jgi:hypothetical protein